VDGARNLIPTALAQITLVRKGDSYFHVFTLLKGEPSGASRHSWPCTLK
jgi:hypothetical protein